MQSQWCTYCLGCNSKYKWDHPLDMLGMDGAQKFEAERACQEGKEEDGQPDDGAIKIDDNEEYIL